MDNTPTPAKMEPLVDDDGLKKIVDRWVAGAVLPEPPYPCTIVRDRYELERTRLTKELEQEREKSARMREALGVARERIEAEDYQGTCGCTGRRRKCPCLDEHNEVISKIDSALNP